MDLATKIAISYIAAAADGILLTNNPAAELRGETIVSADLAKYEKHLAEVRHNYSKQKEKLDRLKTPGVSSPAAGIEGRMLQNYRREGTKALARVEFAKMLLKLGIEKETLSDNVSGDFVVVKKPTEIFKGETLKAVLLPQYRKEEKDLAAKIKELEATKKGVTGRERADIEIEISKLSAERRHALAKITVAKEMTQLGKSSITY
jgi:hypothetical protein